MIIEINDTVRLELTSQKHADNIIEAVNANREHLSKFLGWVNNMQNLSHCIKYIDFCLKQYEDGKEVSFVILKNEELVGRIGLNKICPNNRTASIGYWLKRSAQGQGIITSSCTALMDFGFNDLDLNRIEIRAASENIRSKAIPQRLGFTKEGVLRQIEFINNRYLDIEIYSILKTEWIALKH